MKRPKAKTSTVASFQHRLYALMAEVMWGKAHFHLTRVLKGTHPAIVKTAPIFFDLSANGHGDLTTLYASRIFDRQPRSASIHTLLDWALRSAGTFKNCSAMEVRKAVSEMRQTINDLEPIIRAVGTRRDEALAHLSTRPFSEPEGYVADGRVSYRQLEKLFQETENILDRLSHLYDGRKIPFDMPGLDDVDNLLAIVLESLREKAKRKA
jgi:AbiU2